MTRLWPEGVILALIPDPQQRPASFVWQGRRHQVLTIHEEWQVDIDWWDDAGRVWRDYFVLTTTGGLLCLLYRDRLMREWRLAKIYD